MRIRRTLHFLPIVVLLVFVRVCAADAADDSSGIIFSPSDRILVFAPHPDDEIIGCAGIIQEAVTRKIPVKIVFLTNGDNNEWAFLLYRKHPVFLPGAARAMGSVRQAEAAAAASVLGVERANLCFLGYPDFGTLAIWRTRWRNVPSYQSMLTRVNAVPYQNSYRPGAAYKGEEILADITAVIKDFKPTKIFLSHPGDHNPDHAALYLFTQIALWNLSGDITTEIFPYLVHGKHWPKPGGWHPEETLNPPELFLDNINWVKFPLTSAAVATKRAAIQKHKSQYRSSAAYLLSFARSNELFGSPGLRTLTKDNPTLLLFDTLTPNRGQPSRDKSDLFTGISRERVERKDDTLIFSFDFRRPVAEQADVYIYCFGYRRDRPFRDMPKIQIRLGLLKSGLYDQRKKISFKNIQVIRNPRRITLVIPLSLLGDPHYVMTSSTSYLGEVSLDWPTWYTFEVVS